MLVSVALYVGMAFLHHLENGIYKAEIIELLRWSGYGAFLDRPALTVLWYGSLVVYGAVCIGLIYFKAWARELFVLLTVLILLTSFLGGLRIETEVSLFYGQILNLIGGFIIAMIYFSELLGEFTVTRNKHVQTDRPTAGR